MCVSVEHASRPHRQLTSSGSTRRMIECPQLLYRLKSTEISAAPLHRASNQVPPVDLFTVVDPKTDHRFASFSLER